LTEDGWEALKQGLGAGLLSDECTLFKTGEEVFLVKAGVFLVKVQRKGSMNEYWTNIEAVQILQK